MSRFQQIIERWPSRRELAEDVGVGLHAVHHWHNRGRIPARYDVPMLMAAQKRGIPLEWFELASARVSPSQEPQGGE